MWSGCGEGSLQETLCVRTREDVGLVGDMDGEDTRALMAHITICKADSSSGEGKLLGACLRGQESLGGPIFLDGGDIEIVDGRGKSA